MTYPATPETRSVFRPAAKGLTLMEVAISMALFAVLSVAIASLLTSGMDAQMSMRVHEYEHNVAMNIIDRLRVDLLSAEGVDIAGGGTQLQFTTFNLNTGVPEAVTWSISGGTATRNGLNFGASPSPGILLNISCGGNGAPACFQGFNQSGAATSNDVKRVMLHELTVTHNLGSSSGTAIDRYFGTAVYRVNEFSFDVLPGTTFQ